MALLGWLRSYRQIGNTAQQSIDEVAQAQQVLQRADEFRSAWRVGGVLEVGPVGGDQRLTAVRQKENELQAAPHARLPEDLQRLAFEGMMGTGDRYPFRNVLTVGSVWWLPLTRFRIRNSCSV